MKQRESVVEGDPKVFFTVGHSTRSADEFRELLKAHGVTLLVDVRTIPRSRTNPQFNKENLPETLRAVGIRYVHAPALGGLRKPQKDSANSGWRNLSFRGYADYMQTKDFADALAELLALASGEQPALMCAEAVPWRCHRSLIADALLVRGIPSEDLTSPKKRQPHRLTPFAKVNGEKITYPATTTDDGAEIGTNEKSDEQVPDNKLEAYSGGSENLRNPADMKSTNTRSRRGRRPFGKTM